MQDERCLEALAEVSDIITVDLEAVNVDALARIAQAGTDVIPSPALLTRMTDKLEQKRAMQAAGVPTSPFVAFDGKDRSVVDRFGWPAVNKAARGGYDGRGVVVIGGPEDVDELLPVPGFIEAYVEHDMEIAVMVARDRDGRTQCWPAVEMVFNRAGNLLDSLVAPARITGARHDAARTLATRAIEAFDGTGIFGVEMFLTPQGELLVNEISPRTHNSGHYTMDACDVSQFAQQYRILNNEPIVAPRSTAAAVMFNLLGEPGYAGETVVEGEEALARMAGVHTYIYGKETCFPLRKMGHVTVTAPTVDEALAIMDAARPLITIRGANPE